MTTVDGKHFGNRLREARLQAGFSQSELEDLSGIPKARLSRYENGHVEPSIQTLARLARALNVSEASLLGDQRATLEGFFDVLSSRGVRIESAEQGVRLANAVADMVNALGGMGSFVGHVDGAQDGPIQDGSNPVEHVGRGRSELARRRLLTFRPRVPRTSSPHEHAHRRGDRRRPPGVPRRPWIVRRVLSRVVGSRRTRSALQGNISRSTSGSLRAMHFHRMQWDYWFVVAGEMFVALADLRTGSPTERADLDAAIVCGDAREACSSRPGSRTGSSQRPISRLGYLVDRYFDGSDEWGIAWNDPELGIDWPAAGSRPVRAGSEQSRAWRRRSGTRSRTPRPWVDLAARRA